MKIGNKEITWNSKTKKYVLTGVIGASVFAAGFGGGFFTGKSNAKPAHHAERMEYREKVREEMDFDREDFSANQEFNRPFKNNEDTSSSATQSEGSAKSDSSTPSNPSKRPLRNSQTDSSASSDKDSAASSDKESTSSSSTSKEV